VLSCCDFADFNGNALVYIIASLTTSPNHIALCTWDHEHCSPKLFFLKLVM